MSQDNCHFKIPMHHLLLFFDYYTVIYWISSNLIISPKEMLTCTLRAHVKNFTKRNYVNCVNLLVKIFNINYFQ